MPKFSIESRSKNIPDIFRSFKWELSIPEISIVAPSFVNEEGFTIRARSVSIPQRGVEVIESNFMGMKQIFPGRNNFANTVTVTLEETEDMLVTKGLYEWQQRIFNIDPDSDNNGGSEVERKRELTTDIFLKAYKYNNDQTDRMFRLFNAFPQDVAEVALDYTGNEAVQYSVTFYYDFHKLIES